MPELTKVQLAELEERIARAICAALMISCWEELSEASRRDFRQAAECVMGVVRPHIELKAAECDRIIDVAVRSVLEPLITLLNIRNQDVWSLHELAVRRAKAALERESGAA